MPRTRDIWNLVASAIEHADRILLYGPPGTGKTTAGCRAGDPSTLYKVTLHEEMPAAELQGFFMPDGDRFKWHDGLAVRAWRDGARLVLDEVDRASGDALTMLYAILDDPEVAALSLPTGETVYPRTGFKVVATMNGRPEDLPDALRDRFEVSIEINEANPKAIEALPEDIRRVAESTVANEDPNRRASVRNWKSFASLRKDMGDDLAAQAVFGDRAEEVLDSLRVASA